MSFQNGTDFVSNLCGDLGVLWDINIVWDSEHPNITPCMRETVLPWVCAVWIGIIAPLYAYRTSTLDARRYRMRSNWLNITRMTISLMLCLIWLLAFVSALTDRHNDKSISMAYVVTPAIVSASMLISAILYQLERRAALITSGVHSIFWTLHFLVGIIILQSLLREPIEDRSRLFDSFFIHFVLVVIQFLFVFITEKPRILYHQNVCPEATASFFSRATFWWINSLILKGYRSNLVESDLWTLNPRDITKTNLKKFEEEWDKAIEKKKKSCKRRDSDVSIDVDNAALLEDSSNYAAQESVTLVDEEKKAKCSVSLWRVLLRVGWPALLQAHLCKLVCDGLVFVGPMLQKRVIAYVSATDDVYVWKGYVYAVMFFVTAILNSFFFHQLYHIGMTLGMRLKAVIIGAVYKKALTMNSDSYRSSTVGEIVNLMSVDAQRIQDITGYIWMVWSAPLQIGISLYMLWGILGASILSGLAVMILMLPINAITATIQRKLQIKQMKLKDERIKLMNEILNGIKVLKLYAWENSFKDKIKHIRDQELVTLKSYSYLGAVTNFLWTTSPFLIMLATFLTYVLTGGKLDAEKAFVSLSLFNILQFPITVLPMLIAFLIQASVSLKRLGKFMQNEDLDKDNVQHDDSNVNAVHISNGNFAWGLNEDDGVTLKNINIAVKVGELKAIVGRVGEGKSSLLSAILGEMYKLTGKVNVKGNVAYVAQQAWIQNATVRDNILFSSAYDEKRYRDVIKACELLPDIEILPAGDKTEIGEKGINLSGGQKQRISLARAVYADADNYIFDDPLSALDAHVGKSIFENVMSSNGLLKNKTRILVTHGVHWLPRVDSIVVLVDGCISEQGSYNELIENNGAFAQFLKQYLSEEHESDEDESDGEIEKTKSEILKRLDSLNESEDILSSSAGSHHTPHLRKRQKKTMVKGKSKLQIKKELEKTKEELKAGKLIDKEKEEVGTVSIKVFSYYLKACGWILMSCSISMYLIYTVLNMYTSIWLSDWTQDPLLNNATLDPHSNEFISRQMMYLGVYSSLGISQTLLVLIYCLGIALCSVNASRIMHRGMLNNILRSPMSFFETTPSGRILNRFSRDIETIDNTLISLFRNWINNTSIVISTVIIICYSTPIFATMIVPMAILYYFIQRFYIPTSRQLKRIEATTRSPIYVHFSESVTGAATIRAFGKQEYFMNNSEKAVDHNLVFYFANIVSNRWIGMRLEFIGAVVVFSAAMFAVIGRGSINAGLVGLSLTYALEITTNLNFMVRMTSELEANIVSVERIKEYTETETEAEWELENNVAPDNWPTNGNVNFENYEVRYREGLELVLKGINLDIKSGEKIGVVGRTGAGKSSLTLALFRIIEAASGHIKIDGVPISKLGLHHLRKNITILPQDPVLFSGSLRMNIDPTGEHEDHRLWSTLEHSQLRDFVEGLPAGLDYEVGESGGNLSIGQRQLVCLARTLLRDTKILILDEATAAVDLQTDEFIQQTIRERYIDSTVITIAHRINTIVDSDKVLLLDSGNIKEFDKPQVLLNDKKSSFYAMAKDAGVVS